MRHMNSAPYGSDGASIGPAAIELIGEPGCLSSCRQMWQPETGDWLYRASRSLSFQLGRLRGHPGPSRFCAGGKVWPCVFFGSCATSKYRCIVACTRFFQSPKSCRLQSSGRVTARNSSRRGSSAKQRSGDRESWLERSR